MLFHSLLASIIFAEKSTIYYFVGVPLELINHFALEAFKIFFFCLRFLIFLLSCVCGSLYVYLSWSSFSFLDVYINIFQ